MTARKTLSPRALIPLIIVIVIVGLIAFVGFIQLTLHASRNTEQAQLAYEYVVSSDVFRRAGLAPEDLRMNEYSVNRMTRNGETSATAEITFTVRQDRFRKYIFCVTCHQENGKWTVRADRTRITVRAAGLNT